MVAKSPASIVRLTPFRATFSLTVPGLKVLCSTRSSSISILHTLLPCLTGRTAALLKGDLLPDGGHRDGHRHDDGADQLHGSSRDVEAESHRHDKTVEAAAEHDAQHTAHHRPLAHQRSPMMRESSAMVTMPVPTLMSQLFWY